MGNYNFRVSSAPKPGSVVTVKDDEFSRDNEIPTDILRRGQKVKVIKTTKLYQSNENEPPIIVTKVQTQQGTIETYITKNLI